MSEVITISTKVNAPIGKVWEYWNGAEHIPHWAFASDDWGAEPKSNDLRVGGDFVTEMFARDRSVSFDFAGTYTAVQENELLEYDLGDARHVKTVFTDTPDGVEIVQSFDAEGENPIEMQRAGWQAFLDNFKSYIENS